MGTYTTNYNLFMPSLGEQGWGELVNGNFATIDTAMEGLNTRVGTLEAETDAMKEKLDAIDITTDGAIDGDFVGNVTGNLVVDVSSVENSIIGTYTAVTDVETKTSPTFTIQSYGGTGPFTTVSINVTDVLTDMIKGFTASENKTVAVKVTVTAKMAYQIATNTGLVLRIYRNDTQVSVSSVANTATYSHSATVLVSPNDVISAKPTLNRQSTNDNCTGTLTITVSEMTGNLYIA